MYLFTLFFGLVVVALIIARQRRVRPVPRRLRLRFPVLLGIIGIVEVVSFSDHHHLSATKTWAVVLAVAVGAGLLGAIRAATVRIWTADGWVLNQGTWVTTVLWLVSLALHFSSTWLFDAAKVPNGVDSATLLLYLALTYGAQRAVVYVRGARHWREMGPPAAGTAPFGTIGNPGGGFFATTFGAGPFGSRPPGATPGDGPHLDPGGTIPARSEEITPSPPDPGWDPPAPPVDPGAEPSGH